MNLVWLKNDLRLEDNAALFNASKAGLTTCIYLLTPQQWADHEDSSQKISFWRERLIELEKELKQRNIPLLVINAENYERVPHALLSVLQETNSDSLYFNIEYPLNEKKRDQAVVDLCTSNNIHTHTYHGDIVLPPGSVRTQQDAIYKVFTPFCRQWHKVVTEQDLIVLPAPQKQSASIFDHLTIPVVPVEEYWKETSPQHYRKDLWPIDSDSIHHKLIKFCETNIVHYKENRDIPSINGTSTLSPYLASGMLSVRQCLFAARRALEDWRSNQWVTELIWREFYKHLSDQFPHLSRSENFIKIKNPIPWENNDEIFKAWCEGRTGFPIVDAAMKQLVQSGWMHNRLRMVTAAFLTKILLVDWRKGESFFMQHLLDGDYASNNGGWQWAASTGADAAPYFRIFNPERQSQRFDKEGAFIKKLLPELKNIPNKNIHTPTSEQRQASGYPDPIIDYKWARQRALDGYAHAMGKTKNA